MTTHPQEKKSGLGKWIAVAVIGLALVVIFAFLILAAFIAVIAGAENERQSSVGCMGVTNAASSTGVTAEMPQAPGDLRKQQISNAQTINRVVEDLGLPGKAAEIAIIAAMGESTLINLDYGDEATVTNPDGSATTSKGLFQQQTSQGWGTVEQVTNPEYATKSFLLGPKHDGNGGLTSVAGWQDREITLVINEVQSNQDASHYARSYDAAREIMDAAGIDTTREGDTTKMDAAGITTEEDSGDTITTTALSGCAERNTASSAMWDGDLGPGEWTNPLPGSVVTSGYGPRNIPGVPAWAQNHVGVDMATPASGPAGQVIAPTKMRVTGFLDHDGCVMTKQVEEPHFGFAFCHMSEYFVVKDDVLEKGQTIGVEGNKGQISGMARHTHVEMYKPGSPEMNYPYQGFNIDPMPILKEKGALPQ